MAPRRKQTVDLAAVFQAASADLAENRTGLNQADEYNHNHGDNMVEIFSAINEAMASRPGKTPSAQLAYASKLVQQRSQSGSAQMYARGLAEAAQQFKGKSVTPENLSTLLGMLLGGQAGGQAPSLGTASGLMGTLMGTLAGAQSANTPAAGGQAAATGDLLGSLLGGVLGGAQGAAQGGGQAVQNQPGLDLGDLLNAGMAFMGAQQAGQGVVPSLIQAFVSATQAGQSQHRARSGEMVASAALRGVGKRPQ